MALPRFYIDPAITGTSGLASMRTSGSPLTATSGPDLAGKIIVLDEDNSKHIVQVLRMRIGEQLLLTDGLGNMLEGAITDDHKKKCQVKIIRLDRLPPADRRITLAVSLLKNASRFEWLLEKATEVGVGRIIPLIGERTEKQHFRQDRMQNILVSAMLQSQQAWLPELTLPTPVLSVIAGASEGTRLIAHCLEEKKQSMVEVLRGVPATGNNIDRIALIGPEGDFTKNEIDTALARGFIPVTLGGTRLRTETAGIVAATLLCIS